MARDAAESAVNDIPLKSLKDYPQSLAKLFGAFVTLRQNRELRGCIGYIEGTKPLVETVQDAAEKSAMEDPRFHPVTPEELASLEIEISILSPLQRITTIDEIEIGKHGLVLEWKHSRGLLLPQVPLEYGWDREMFLNQVSRKAGMPAQTWKNPDAKLFIFSAEILGSR